MAGSSHVVAFVGSEVRCSVSLSEAYAPEPEENVLPLDFACDMQVRHKMRHIYTGAVHAAPTHKSRTCR